MSLLDKFKNLFTDEEEYEEEEEIPIKPIKNEKKSEDVLPTFMREKIEREKEDIKELEDTNDLVKQIHKNEEKKSENVVVSNKKSEDKKEDKNFKFPIAFEEKDFVETTRQSKQNVIYQEKEKIKEKEEAKKKKASEIYGSKKEKKEVSKFKASPIISPIYGVLDKNYKKEEVKVNGSDRDILSNYEAKNFTKSEVKVDFETVRKKAFGSLTDEIRDNLNCESCEFYQEAKKRYEESEKEKFFDSPKNDISVGEAAENYYDFGVSYEPVHRYDDEDEVKIVNHEDNDLEAEQIEIKEPSNNKPNVLSTLRKSMGGNEEEKKEEVPQREKKSIEDLELTDDLFNLIDSMYDERNDD